jgi:ribulose-phosphate 3-epimerase
MSKNGQLICGKIKLLPSLLASDFAKLSSEAQIVLDHGAFGLHADVMDGQFVPPITYGADVIAAVINHTDAWVDAHLMIKYPENQIEAMAKAGVTAITVHAETCQHLHRVLGMIKDFGCEAGVALNPGTPVESTLEFVAPLLDRVLIMTVNPGWGGQAFIPEGLIKVKRTSQLLAKHEVKAEIQVDGGVSAKTAGALVESGATELVAGSAVYKGNVQENIAAIRRSIESVLTV